MAGFLAALRCERCVGEVINTGSGFEISIGDTARLIAAVMGVEVEIVADEQRLRPQASEVERLCAASDKAHELLGWQPAVRRAGWSAAWPRRDRRLVRTRREPQALQARDLQPVNAAPQYATLTADILAAIRTVVGDRSRGAARAALCRQRVAIPAGVPGLHLRVVGRASSSIASRRSSQPTPGRATPWRCQRHCGAARRAAPGAGARATMRC